MRFFGDGSENSNVCQAVFHANLVVSPFFSRSCVTKHSIVEKENSGDYSVPFIWKVFSKKNRQNHWHVRITSFVYDFCNSGQILLIVNANSEFTWTTADTVFVYKLFVFHSSWILGRTREISFWYIYCVPPVCLVMTNNPFSDFAFLWRRRIHMIWDH